MNHNVQRSAFFSPPPLTYAKGNSRKLSYPLFPLAIPIRQWFAFQTGFTSLLPVVPRISALIRILLVPVNQRIIPTPHILSTSPPNHCLFCNFGAILKIEFRHCQLLKIELFTVNIRATGTRQPPRSATPRSSTRPLALSISPSKSGRCWPRSAPPPPRTSLVACRSPLPPSDAPYALRY
jgi:hypothetical protein